MREFYVEQIQAAGRGREGVPRRPVGQDPRRGAGTDPLRLLYVPLSGAHTIVPPAIIFNLVGESWTLSMFEASNYGVFLGDMTTRIAKRIIDEAERVGAEDVVISECGHAYAALRWEAPKWFGGPLPFRVRSILEVLDEWRRAGRPKANQIRRTEAEYVIASRGNCRIQLGDITEHYGLGTKVMGLAELVVRALDLPRLPGRNPAPARCT